MCKGKSSQVWLHLNKTDLFYFSVKQSKTACYPFQWISITLYLVRKTIPKLKVELKLNLFKLYQSKTMIDLSKANHLDLLQLVPTCCSFIHPPFASSPLRRGDGQMNTERVACWGRQTGNTWTERLCDDARINPVGQGGVKFDHRADVELVSGGGKWCWNVLWIVVHSDCVWLDGELWMWPWA